MGLNYYLHLFDKKVYQEKVLPAHRAFFKRRDDGPLNAIVQEIIARHPGARKQLSQGLQAKKDYEEALAILNGQQAYHSSYDYLFENGVSRKLLSPKELFVRDLLTQDILMAVCVPRYKGINSEQNMGRTALIPYLYEHSIWMEEMFTGIREPSGKYLEVIKGEGAMKLFTKADIKEFYAEFDKVPPPNAKQEVQHQYEKGQTQLRASLKTQMPEESAEFQEMFEIFTGLAQAALPTAHKQLRKEYKNLRALLNLCLAEPNLTLTLSIS